MSATRGILLSATIITILIIFRRIELEKKLETEAGSDERKKRQLQNLGKKESTFLRLKRTKLGLQDFATIKVIGKGAFGEVISLSIIVTIFYSPHNRSDWSRKMILVEFMQ